MKKIILLVLVLSCSVSGMTFFDNGSGDKDDTVCLMFNVWNEAGTNITADFDSVLIYRRYGNTVFDTVKITVPEDYDIGNVFPMTACFEVRRKASNASGNTGAYTWWAVAFGDDGAHSVSKGWYYVNDKGIGTITAEIDSIRDSLFAVLDSLQRLATAYTNVRAAYLDAAISSRSTLTTSDNIGINWGDITNQSATVNLSGTTTNLVNTATNVTNMITPNEIWRWDISGEESADYAGGRLNMYLNKAIDAVDDNPWDNPKSDSGAGMGDWLADWFHDLNDDSTGGGGGGAGADTAAIKAMMLANKFARTYNAAGGADTVYVKNAGTPVVDTAAIARSVWDDDIVASKDRTIGKIPDGGITVNSPSAGFYGAIADTVLNRNLSAYADSIGSLGQAVYRIEYRTDGIGGDGIEADIDNIYNEIIGGVQAIGMDSLTNRVGYLMALVGHPNATPQWDTIEGNIQDKLGSFVPSGTNNIKSILDTTQVYVGKHGVSTPQVSLHMKLGEYSGAVGDNVKTEKFSGAKFDSTYYDSIALHATGADSIIAVMNLPDSVVRRLDSLKYAWFGWGAYPETIVVLDNEAYSPVSNARIRINNVNGTATRVVNAPTNVNGKKLLYLDTTSYQVVVTAEGYEQKTDTVAVSVAAKSDTILLSAFDPGNPPAPDLCRVYGWIQDISGGQTKNAEIAVEIPRQYHPVKYNGVVITPFNKSVFSDSTGYWQIDLYPNSLLASPLSRYLFTIKYGSGIIYRLEVEVPDQASWQLR